MTRFTHLACLFLALLGATSAGWTQGTMAGRVTDEDGSPLPGCTVATTTGKAVATDLDGKYVLSLPAGNHDITFSFIGYLNAEKSVTIQQGQTLDVSIRLQEDAVSLENAIVVGYGTQRKKEVTGAISTINSKEITAVRTPSFEAALQGQAAGVQVTQGSGMAGSGSIIRIRGLSSISAGGDPLYVVDGIPITQNYFAGGNQGAMNRNPLASINPNDIEDIQILKDAAATGIYGSRGANGVILITTKRGVSEGIKVNYSSTLGYGEPSAKPNMMNTEEYLTIRQEAWENDGGTGYVWLPYLSSISDSPEARRAAYEEALNTDTDWFDLMTRRAQKTTQNVSFQSGGKWWSMYNGLSYDKNESFAVGNSYTRRTLRTNLTLKPVKGLKLDLQGSTAEGINQRVDGGWSGGIGAAMSSALPYMSPFVLDTLFDENGDITDIVRDFELDRWGNPYVSFFGENRLWRETERRNLLTGQLLYSPVKSVDVVLTGGLDKSTVVEDNWRGEVYHVNDPNADTRLNWSERTSPNYNFGGNVTFHLQDSDTASMSLMVGGEAQKLASSGFWANVRNVEGPSYYNLEIADSLGYFYENDTLVPANWIEGIFGWVDIPTTFASSFARFNYSLKDKYFLQATARVDGSSKFGANYRFGFFPSVSFGWVMSDEAWFQAKNVSFLKFRTSWGRTGNSNIGASDQWRRYTDQTGGFTYAGMPIVFPQSPGNSNLRWETVSTVDASIEMGLFDDRISIEIGGYNKLASDVLMTSGLPSHTGWPSQSVNAGEVLNRGLEFAATSNNLNQNREFQWKTTANYNYNYNELVSTGGYTPDAISGGTNDSRAVPGESLTTYFLVPFSHVDPETGLPVYLDLEGNETFEYNLENRQAVGDGLPDHIAGLTNEFHYRNWSLSALFTASIGAKIWDSSAKRQLGVVTDWNMRTELFDRWRQPGDESMFPMLTLDETRYGLPNGFPWWNTSLFMYDASYVRLRNVNLSYNVPMATGNITLGVSGNNLFALTNFVGLDPELVRDFENAQDRNFSGGANYLTAPQERSVIFSIAANF